MAQEKFDLDALKGNGFATKNRKFLEKAHTILLGYDAEAAESDDVIRNRLKEVVGPNTSSTPIIAQLHKDTTSQPIDLRVMPNLSGNGKWDGRMRRVTYVKSDPNSSEDVITPRWEEVKQDLQNGVPTDLIWPLYENLISAVDIALEKDFEFEKSGKNKGRLMVTETTKRTPKYTYIDHGDVPGTEDKPEDYLRYFWRVAKKTHMFKGVSRALILRVHTILFGPEPITKFVGVTDQDLRLKIAVNLGPEYEQLMQEELYGDALSASA